MTEPTDQTTAPEPPRASGTSRTPGASGTSGISGASGAPETSGTSGTPEPAGSPASDGASGAPEVVCVGETMAMIGPEDSRPLATAAVLSLRTGGAESNVACGLASLGHPAAWLSRVGDDPFGRRVLAELRERGVDVGDVETDPVRKTGVYFKDTGAGGTGVHYYRRDSAASRMGPELARLPRLARARVLHLSGITPALSGSCAELVEEILVRRTVPGSPLVSFDVNHRAALWPGGREEAAAALLRLSRAADLVFVGRDEAESLWGTRKADEVRDLLSPAPHVVVKDGGHGAWSYDRGSEGVFVPTPTSDVVERVGAGDAFAAGYLAGLLEGRDPVARLRLGHLAAATALTTRGDVAALPPRDELDRRLALDTAGWSRLHLTSPSLPSPDLPSPSPPSPDPPSPSPPTPAPAVPAPSVADRTNRGAVAR